jgi:hypothetical protein
MQIEMDEGRVPKYKVFYFAMKAKHSDKNKG